MGRRATASSGRGRVRFVVVSADQLVDLHTHAQPTAAAGLALQRWIGGPPAERSGAVEELLGLMDRASIASSLIVPWLPLRDLVEERLATGVDRQQATSDLVAEWQELNRWAARAVRRSGGRLDCLVGLDPTVMPPPLMAEMAREGLAQGASGLKVAPAFVLAFPDDDVMTPLWELARDLGVFVLAESGAGHFRGRPAYGHPSRFEAVLAAYPDVRIMLAHLGIGAEDEVARLTARHPNLFTDLSLRLPPSPQARWDANETAGWLRRIGTDRVVYGSNYPLVDPVAFAESFRRLLLTEEEAADIGWRNAGRLLARHQAPTPGG